MRMMLGFGNEPIYLIEVDSKYIDSDNFPFEVINGCHCAEYRSGIVYSPYVEPFGIEIISKDQNRLRGDYQTVFINWDNSDYAVHVSKIDMPEDWADNIPF